MLYYYHSNVIQPQPSVPALPPSRSRCPNCWKLYHVCGVLPRARSCASLFCLSVRSHRTFQIQPCKGHGAGPQGYLHIILNAAGSLGSLGKFQVTTLTRFPPSGDCGSGSQGSDTLKWPLRLQLMDCSRAPPSPCRAGPGIIHHCSGRSPRARRPGRVAVITVRRVAASLASVITGSDGAEAAAAHWVRLGRRRCRAAAAAARPAGSGSGGLARRSCRRPPHQTAAVTGVGGSELRQP